MKRKEEEKGDVNTTIYYGKIIRRKKGIILFDSKILKLSKSRISWRSVTLFESQVEYMFAE